MARQWLGVIPVSGIALAAAVAQTLTWSIATSPNPGSLGDNLAGVSCVSTAFCVAVGSDSKTLNTTLTLVESWNGTKWSVVTSPDKGSGTDAHLDAVSCVSASDCTAVGGYFVDSNAENLTLVESWNGTKWSIVPSPNPQPTQDNLYGVSCVSASFCVAVGNELNGSGSPTNLIESWNGTKWSAVTSPDPGADGDGLFGVSCISASDCTAVGNYSTTASNALTLVESWNGTKWSVVTSPNQGSGVIQDGLEGTSCVSASDCTAVGFYINSGGNGQTLVESWNGTKWSIVTSPDPGPEASLYGVSCVSSSDCAAAGFYNNSSDLGRTLIESWNGTTWTVASSPNQGSVDNYLYGGVSCATTAACTAVGYYRATPQTNLTLIETGKAGG